MKKYLWRSLIFKTGNPGHPVVSSINYHTNTISKYVDFNLQPTVKNIPSFVSGTTDFLQKLDKVKNIPNDCLLLTFDVKSLYTNVAKDERIKLWEKLIVTPYQNSIDIKWLQRFEFT